MTGELINQVCEPQELFLIWRSPNQESGYYAVALLKRCGSNSAVFTYLNETEDFQKACADGFDGYPSFEKFNEVYANDVLDVFTRRIPSRKREDFKLYLNDLGLESEVVISDFALLAYSGAQLATDSFKFIPSLNGINLPCQLIMEVAGVRHHAGLNISRYTVDSKVMFKAEPDNARNSNAVAVYCLNNRIGYVSRCVSLSLISIMNRSNISGKIFKLNGTVERPRIFIKISIA